MYLYILRHAWAGHFGDPNWPDDSQRPLTDEGVARFREVAQRLVSRDVRPSVIATSPYVRCEQTAALLAEAIDPRPDVVPLVALQPGSDVAALVDWTGQQDADEICWVGHAPDVGRMVATLIGDRQAQVRFAKGACAAVRCMGPLRPGQFELYWHVTAKVLGV